MTDNQTRLRQFLVCHTAQMCLAGTVALAAPCELPPAQLEEIAELDVRQRAMIRALTSSGAGVLTTARKLVKSFSAYLLKGIPRDKEEPTPEEAMSYWLHALFTTELMLQDAVFGCPMFASGVVWERTKDLIRKIAKRYAPPDKEQLPEEITAWKTYMHFVKAIKSEVANRKKGK